MIGDYVNNWRYAPHGREVAFAHRVLVGFRYYCAWRHSLQGGRNALADRKPWITFEARDFIEPVLASDAVVFEYGAGGSTIFYAKRVKQVVSVEHDLDWANRVNAVLLEAKIDNCKFQFIPAERSEREGNCEEPADYCSSSEAYRGYSFRRYVLAIDPFPDESFDLVAVDGRARPACILHARRKVKLGGYILLDNSEWPHYQKGKDLLKGWEKHQFYGPGPYGLGFWETTVWRKI